MFLAQCLWCPTLREQGAATRIFHATGMGWQASQRSLANEFAGNVFSRSGNPCMIGQRSSLLHQSLSVVFQFGNTLNKQQGQLLTAEPHVYVLIVWRHGVACP